MKNFLDSRHKNWKRLEELTNRASQMSLTKLSSVEVREFGRLYRRTAADLAIAREEVKDKRLASYLNHLVGRAHGTIYRSDASGWRSITDFLRFEFPAVFRQTSRYIALSFAICLGTGLFAGLITARDESFADRIAPGYREKIASHYNWTESANESNPLVSTQIQTNNITVTFIACASGVVWGVGTVYVLISNGLMIGTLISLCIRYHFWEILIFMSGHGVIELTAIFISGGAGLLIGKALLIPGNLKRIDALVTNGLLAVKLLMGCVPMLLIAGTIEGFVSPAHISMYFKFAVAIVSGIVMIFYFLKPDTRLERSAVAQQGAAPASPATATTTN